MIVSTQAVRSALATSSTGSSTDNTADSTAVKKTLGQDDFLKLLVAQLGAQDPLNPQKDTDYLAQLAQFSSLEQAKATQESLSQIRSDQQLTQAQSLLGRTVQVSTDGTTTLTGVVDSVQMVEGKPKLSVGGLLYDLSQITAVSSDATTTTHLGLLGKSKF